MSVVVITGAQWGDEGKGKIVDVLAQKANVVVRFSGGDNAGHTVVNPQGEFRLHLVPSGIFSAQATCIIANGVVINPAVLIGEIDQLTERGVDTSRLFVSDRAHLIMPYHILLDGLEEEARGGRAIGTTRKGVGPAFTDKVARLGIRVGDLLDEKVLSERLGLMLDYKNTILTKVYGAAPLSFEEVYTQYLQYGQRLVPYIRETTAVLEEALVKGGKVLLEGTQGVLLDPDFGTYPYTTSSSPLAGGSCVGAGLGPTLIDNIMGVFKAYCSRVGGGPMPTELHGETGDLIREKGHEYGTTTGRPRRCGWFDAVAARFSTRVGGFTGAVLTRLDILDDFKTLKIGTGYELDGRVINHFPSSITALERCRPVYEELPGWQAPTSGVRRFGDLPLQAQQYVNRLEELIACPFNIVSVGAGRLKTIIKKPVF